MELLGTGRTADVFALGTDRVLRRYRDGSTAEGEAAVMAYVGGFGYPVPKVFQVAGPEMVMERVYGPTMIEAILGDLITLEHAVAQLAVLHRTLHELPARISTDAGSSVIHLDLHPLNVIMSDRGPVVIDWNNATDGAPGFDIAVSALILAEVAIDPVHPLAAVAAAAVPLFRKYAGRPADAMIDAALAMRLANPTLSAEEKGRLPQAVSLVQSSRVA
jgi:aminoglycoside phosphotransferase (APT) family kinase protein